MKTNSLSKTQLIVRTKCFCFVFLAFDFLSVLRGHSVFSSPPQRPMTSDCEGFSIPDFIHYIYFPILILEKEPVFPFLMFSAKQGNDWYHFYNDYWPVFMCARVFVCVCVCSLVPESFDRVARFSRKQAQLYIWLLPIIKLCARVHLQQKVSVQRGNSPKYVHHVLQTIYICDNIISYALKEQPVLCSINNLFVQSLSKNSINVTKCMLQHGIRSSLVLDTSDSTFIC